MTGGVTNSTVSKLQCGKEGQHTLIAPSSTDSNMVIFHLAPGYKNYTLFSKMLKLSTRKTQNLSLTQNNTMMRRENI